MKTEEIIAGLLAKATVDGGNGRKVSRKELEEAVAKAEKSLKRKKCSGVSSVSEIGHN